MATKTDTTLVNKTDIGSIIIGGFISVAITILFVQFLSAIDFSRDSALRNAESLSAASLLAVGVGILFVQAFSSFFGGYAAGYLKAPIAGLKDHEMHLTDGLYGLGAWAVATILTFVGIAFAATLSGFAELLTDAPNMVSDPSDIERNIRVILGFATGVSSIVSAVLAFAAGALGGNNRANSTDLSYFVNLK